VWVDVGESEGTPNWKSPDDTSDPSTCGSFISGLGLIVALGLVALPAALRRLPGLRAPEPAEGDDADQP